MHLNKSKEDRAMKNIVSELFSDAAFVVAEIFLELRNIVLEVFYETLCAFIAALNK